MKLRKIMAVLMAASVAASLAGCGGSSSSGSSDSSSDSASSDSGKVAANTFPSRSITQKSILDISFNPSMVDCNIWFDIMSFSPFHTFSYQTNYAY